MSIVLFAMIGAMLNAGAAYWIIFGFYCTFQLIEIIASIVKSDLTD